VVEEGGAEGRGGSPLPQLSKQKRTSRALKQEVAVRKQRQMKFKKKKKKKERQREDTSQISYLFLHC
jgi:hypothetical protein